VIIFSHPIPNLFPQGIFNPSHYDYCNIHVLGQNIMVSLAKPWSETCLYTNEI